MNDRHLADQVRRSIARGVLEQQSDPVLMQVSMSDTETRDAVEHFQPFGLHAMPVSGAEGLHLAVGGDRDHGVVVAMTNRDLIPADLLNAMRAGETALWAAGGWYMHLKTNGTLRINVRKIEITADDGTSFGGGVAIGKNLTVDEGMSVKGESDFADDVSIRGLSFYGHGHDGIERGLGTSNGPVEASNG
ncbi:phage baseplate assembly protein V [Paraburkholderia adhaesiva]|uniref:phage baseplate assembly protein V n=1 Tax=Paraburkholderia adhaesiva TaxID=2883244 RepID=UPI001F2F6A34|nr:phage baseplate assembly protein V [Paraburkholderia adhaesiva]